MCRVRRSGEVHLKEHCHRAVPELGRSPVQGQAVPELGRSPVQDQAVPELGRSPVQVTELS